MRKIYEEVKESIQKAHESETTVTEAESLSAKALSAQLQIADDLRGLDLDARMRKRGLKAVRAEAYMHEISKHEKKPSEGYLEAATNLSPSVQAEEKAFDEAEVERDYLERYMKVFGEFHHHCRAIMKASFSGG